MIAVKAATNEADFTNDSKLDEYQKSAYDVSNLAKKIKSREIQMYKK